MLCDGKSMKVKVISKYLL